MSSIHSTCENIPKPSLSSSTTTSSSSTNERWQKRQAERMRQLQDMEQQITDATNHSKRRIDLRMSDQHDRRLLDDVDSRRSSTTPSATSSSIYDDSHNNNYSSTLFRSSSRGRGERMSANGSEVIGMNDKRQSALSSTSFKRGSSNSGRQQQQHADKIDLRDASLEDLEDLIAASAQRLANYRLQKSSEALVSHGRSDSSSGSLVYSPTKISHNMGHDNSSHFADLLGDDVDNDEDDMNDEDDGRLTQSDANLSFSTGASLLDDSYPPHSPGAVEPRCSVTTHSSGAGEAAATVAAAKKEKKVVTSPTASYVSSIRNKFEMAGSNDFDKSQQLILQFDPLLSTKQNKQQQLQQQHQSALQHHQQQHLHHQRAEQLDLLTGSPSSSDEITMRSTQPVLSPSQSNLRSVAEAKERRARRPSELNVSELMKDRAANNNSSSAKRSSESPKTPTRLPTPRSSNASGTFPRASFPAPSSSPSSRRIRTLSTVDKDQDTLKWIESELKADNSSSSSSTTSKTSLTGRRSLTKPPSSSTTVLENKRVQSIIMSPPSRSSSTLRKSTSNIHKKIGFADHDGDDERTGSGSNPVRQRKTKSTHTLRSFDGAASGDGSNGGEHVASRSARTRTISMLSAGTGANRRSVGDHLADFDPLLEDEKMMSASLLDDEEEHRWEPSKKKYPPLRARVVSMTASSSTSHDSARKVAQERANRTKRRSNGAAPRPHETQSMTTKAVSGRKRGKTFSGSLASPSMAPLALPPMKMEPLGLAVPDNPKETAAKHLTRSAARTPTRIPLPISSRTSRQSRYQDSNTNCSSTASEDELSGSERERPLLLNCSNNTTSNNVKLKKNNDLTMTGAAKVGPTTTVYSGSMVVSSSTSARYSGSNSSSTKPSASSSIRTTASTKTPKRSSSSSRPHKVPSTTTSENGITRQRKLSTLSSSATTSATTKSSAIGGRKHSIVNDILHDHLGKEKQHKSHAPALNLVSAHGLISPPESIKGNKPSTVAASDGSTYHTIPRRKPTLLHERLQGLVDESNHPTNSTSTAWGSLVEREKKSKPHHEPSSEVTVLRGGSTSTSTTASAKEEMANVVSGQNWHSSSPSSEHSKYIREREKGIRVALSPQGKNECLDMRVCERDCLILCMLIPPRYVTFSCIETLSA
ncbi:hypothetical protein BDB00DRAFT_21415 [Zychaea mexicana]|uniref:uncharacterized protein n=1 Tax=Zychaea mexicana TaxID=64656 RepID=UPI0022FDBEAD|nr:uncharacterized protein BDB00DRAFT_21415 [Zychaea mexicana]KAI9497245.1 hypothetical protein BDB00DRAFT_21415 [Zychaea mexicana]